MALHKMLSLSALACAFVLTGAALTGCGGGDTGDNDTGGDGSTAQSSTGDSAESDDSPGQEPADSEVDGNKGKYGSVTLANGTVLDLELGSCMTHSTDPDSLQYDNFLDVYGTGPEGEVLGLIRAGFSEDNPGKFTFEALHDAGKNAKFYANLTDTGGLVIDGANLSGTLKVDNFLVGDEGDYPMAVGDEIGIEIHCQG